MKTLQELYNEVIASEELKKEFLEAGKNGKAEEFIKNHGCDATADEIKAFLENLTKSDKELSTDELENVAGGTCNDATAYETVFSVLTIAIGCATTVAVSGVKMILGEILNDDPNSIGYIGQQDEDDGRFCNHQN